MKYESRNAIVIGRCVNDSGLSRHFIPRSPHHARAIFFSLPLSPPPRPICLKVKITISRELFLARFHTRHTCATCASRMPHVGGTRENTGTRRGVPHGKFWQALTIPHTSRLFTNAPGISRVHEHPRYKVPAGHPSVREGGRPVVYDAYLCGSSTRALFCVMLITIRQTRAQV